MCGTPVATTRFLYYRRMVHFWFLSQDCFFVSRFFKHNPNVLCCLERLLRPNLLSQWIRIRFTISKQCRHNADARLIGYRHGTGLELACHYLELTYNCLELTYHCLELTYHYQELTYHCLELVCHYLELAYHYLLN